MSDEIILSTDKYDLLGYDEKGEIRRYRDGTLRNENGWAREKIPNDGYEITHENARSYHAMRKAKILRAIEAKVQDVTKTNAPAEAIAAIVGKRAEIAMKDKTRTGNDAAKIVLSAVDAYQVKETVTQQTTRHEYAMDDDTKALLESMLRDRRDALTTRNEWGDDVVDVENNSG
jgi:hypothetical protein